MTCPHTPDLGAYVLGALAPAERSVMERHLPDCRECTAELLTLTPLPGLLRHTSFEAGGSAAARGAVPGPGRPSSAAPPPDRPSTVRLRWGRLLVVAVVAAVVAVALSALGLVLAALSAFGGSGARHEAGRAHNTVTLTHTDPATRVSASMDLTPETWGTALQLRLAHLPPGVVCRLVVHSRQGVTETSGMWTSGSGTDSRITVPASTSVSPSDIAVVDVVTATNRVLVRIG
jgi:hypothetical protein